MIIINRYYQVTTTTQPSGTLLAAATHSIGNDINVPGGLCFPLGNNKGSIIYYFTSNCNHLGSSQYNCMYEFYDGLSQNCANVQNSVGQYISGQLQTCIVEPATLSVLFTTITSSPTSYWSKTKGISYVSSLNSCSNTPLSYSWESSSCLFQNDDYNGDDDTGTSLLYYCTSEGLVTEQYYGSNCKSKNLLLEETLNGYQIHNKYEPSVYDCALRENQNNITIISTGDSFNIGSIYGQIDCKHKLVLSTATIVCLTFFIPLIFYLICWVVIVKIMKRGDLCIKAFCLDNNNTTISKKDDGLASQEVHNQAINRL